MTLSKSIIGLTFVSCVVKKACSVNDFLPGKSTNLSNSFVLDAIILGVGRTLLLFNDILSNPWSTNPLKFPSGLLPLNVLILPDISVPSGSRVEKLGLTMLNAIFCVAIGPYGVPTCTYCWS